MMTRNTYFVEPLEATIVSMVQRCTYEVFGSIRNRCFVGVEAEVSVHVLIDFHCFFHFADSSHVSVIYSVYNIKKHFLPVAHTVQ